MIEELLQKLFLKLQEEPNNDKKSKNGCADFFIINILEERYNKLNLISKRGLIDYFDKYVNQKKNNSGEPSSELKDLIALYLDYDNFLDFENKHNNKGVVKLNNNTTNKKLIIKKSKILVPIIITSLIISGAYFYENFPPKNCIIWKIDHYEKVNCNNKVQNIYLNNVAVDYFKKVNITSEIIFFSDNHAIIWYGKSRTGKMEYFNSRGVHPVTRKELKPITSYIINQYILNK